MMPYKIALVLGFIMVSASCQKVLDTEPTHQLDASQRFNTLDDYESALIGAYALFQQDDYYGELSNAFITLPDMLSDNFNETGESLGNYTTLTSWRYAEDETNIDATWQAAYKVISQANLVLRGLDRFAAEDPGRVNRIKGQALGIRALVHFDILRYWAEEFERNSTRPGIPYISEFNFEARPSRGTIKETYDKMEADLLLAKELLLNTDAVVNQAGRANIDDLVVDAILARMYLYAEEYDKAIEHSSIVIDAIPLADINEFQDIWLDMSTAEVIWSVAFNLGEKRIGDNIYFVPSDRSSYRPNRTLVSMYDQQNDVRFFTYFANISGRRVLGKYLAKGAMINRPDGVVDFKAFRTGEMILIRAEAYALVGQEGLALQDLNTLRGARILGFTPGMETGAALIDAIALERRKELIGEGHRWFDLKRTTRTINRTECTNFCTLNPDDRAWAWPIPLDEISANPNILPQNPGY